MSTQLLIYVIDDDNTELTLWAHFLRRCTRSTGRTFSKFSDLQFAFKQAIPDVVVVDYVMPQVNGLDICYWLMDNYPNVTRYINTMMIGDEYKILAELCGAGYISKVATIQNRIGEICDGR